jgi:tRNA threonylcarbamoyl adenosine modification protein YeaZ
MLFLSLDRSTDEQTIALCRDGLIVSSESFNGSDSRSADWPMKVCSFLEKNGCAISDLDAVLVGQGPGSFAGIRAALAFAQGLVLPLSKKVIGLPSAAGMTEKSGKLAVIGDARRDRFWIVLYDGGKIIRDFILVSGDEIFSSVPEEYKVTTPDAARMNDCLAELFGERYLGGRKPSAQRLAEVAVEFPDALKEEPLPLYLQPAVRPPENKN